MQQNSQQFAFEGKTGEFFKIWIVNIMLSIITLGIYSPWAKVRTRRYFYSNTLLMNMPFDYLADPIKILKGRLLALALILIYAFSPMISPTLQGKIMVIFIPLFPWIIIKAIKFNLYNSAYRNIRFHFTSGYLKALWVFICLPILVALSVGLAYPYFSKERKKFVIDNSAYGTSWFQLSVTTGQFYSIYLKTSGVILLIVFSIAGIIIKFGSPMQDVKFEAEGFLFPLSVITITFGYLYLYTTITNLVFNHTRLKQCQFESHLEATKICWLYFSNTLAIIFSFGLLIPWAMIRTAKYRISCLSVVMDSNIDTFIADEAKKTSAVGEELVDILDIDIGL